MIGEKQNSEPSLGEWKQKEHKISPKVLSQDGHGVMNFLFRIFSSRVVLTGVRSHVVATTVCATGDEHTLTCCTHIFLVYIHCAYTSDILMRVTHKCWLKGVCSTHVVISLSSHFLPSHVSPVLAPAVPWRSLRDHSRPRRPYWLWCPRDPAELHQPKKRRSSAHRTRTSCLATWPSPSPTQVMSPRSSTIILPWMMTRRSLTIQTTRKSLTSRKTHARILDRLVFHQCLNSLFCTFLIGESKESMQSGNRYLTEREREREKKEKVLWSVLQSRCQRKVDGTVLGVILFRLTENAVLMDEISADTWREELNKLFLVKFQFRENYTPLSATWRSKI